MTPETLIPFLAALCGFVLVAGALIYRPRSLRQWFFLLAILALSLEALFRAASFDARSREAMLFWQSVATVATAFLPGIWLVFSLVYGRGEPQRYLRQWLPALVIVGLTPLGLVLWRWNGFLTQAIWTSDLGVWAFPVSAAGKLLHLILLLAAVLVVTQLEWTFRGAVGTARWKIKYIVIGVALLCGARIYSSSQIILYSANHANLVIADSLALLLAAACFGVGVYRSKLVSVDIYPSSTALHKSFSILLAGAYLILVGLLARGIARLGGGTQFPLVAMFILAALAGLGVLCFSDRVRHTTRQWVSRYFKRPAHDYRRVWSEFTRRTAAVLDRQEYIRTVVRLLSETFETLSVTVWLTDFASGQLTFAASTNLEPTRSEVTLLPETVMAGLKSRAVDQPPLDLDLARESWCAPLRQVHPAVFPQGGHRFGQPLHSGGEVIGLLVLGDRVRGMPFSLEDLELLKCLGDQIAAGIHNLNLSENLLRAKELEAFQTMSTFLVHDLKNTASALGLTLKNLPVHFENPAFRADALRTLSRSVTHVNDLIGRLTSLRRKLELHRARVDLNDIITAALTTAGDTPDITIQRESPPVPPVMADRAQMESVVLNLLLNAREAILQAGSRSRPGEIRVAVGHDSTTAWLTVADNGCGISSEFQRESLFKPFKTTKKNGLGIGMFQSKAIVEAHGGKITVQSEPGHGALFQIRLPLAAASPPAP
ncbi:MAG TPA: PEP-CTERM system histidine kinase PrsK [Verrucomicrobiota bacterium]|nr:PEP-CTERM system histidine kinase PrsK [Verrucomicrobiota bacterium]HQB17120.1 PEP-CTERM system histidine kinase PrsK [Verrucomicrobiota bacterium]